MVARIKFVESLRDVMHYNENKLKEKVASFIHAANYGKDTDRLGFTERYKRLELQAAYHETAEKKIVHISLNFDPAEKLDKTRLAEIADAYMQRIGFGGQPYLVYEHYDAQHPHIHIVSTNIRRDGTRIKSHYIGKEKSEPARKEIEKLFGLIPAESGKQKELFQLKHETLARILTQYKYTSIHELNAVLKHINIMADRCRPESRTYKHGGLVYRKLDKNGDPTGVPVKASQIYLKPGLKFLEEKFKQNEELRKPFKQRIKNAVDFAFAGRPVGTMNEFIAALKKERIEVVLRENDKGVIYGLTYIDTEKKCVFNGSDLDSKKQYSANAIQERLKGETFTQQNKQQQKQEPQQINIPRQKQQKDNSAQQIIPFPATDGTQKFKSISPSDGKNILQELIQPEYANDQIPYELKKQKRKRKRKRHHL
ncbi:relaxase [Panacibacter ginsenosidivorans]|uniref:Relaxase n=1 Tax=Panacibacter ginsenosidivorans TaxID=1813871 RepID=A0A5B8VDL9_9BACT|nr:relaxase/mobilization nuclease domain-containing protein [Panacibacter ginsenosidivorans]QEC69369.1 relaxase [Panacibacter ginsenosidivorans]